MEISDIKEMVREEAGFDFEPYSKKFIKRKISNRMNMHDIESYSDYAEYLETNPEEYSMLVDTISIPVTEFFRDEEVYEDFKKEVIPEVVEKKKEKGHTLIRIWSAGCATGEEPYSIAMLLDDVLGSELDNFKLSIYGTDIDEMALESAKKGLYSSEDVEEVPSEYLQKYFKKEGEGYKVKNKLKEYVKFSKHDLVAGEPMKAFDVIFCRNMLIYFSPETHKKIHMRLYNSLRDGGYFIIGKTELLKGKAREKFERVTNNRVFRKPSDFLSSSN